MNFFFQSAIVILLILIVYQDFKYRAIVWVAFPLLFLSILLKNLIALDWEILLEGLAYNFYFLILLFAGVTLYFSIKERKLIDLTKGYLGWGDILFLFCLAIFFSPLNFILFYIISGVIIISAVLCLYLINRMNTQRIPLAGLQGLVLLILLLINQFYPFMNFLNDEWIINQFI